MITYVAGSLFESPAQVLVNTINTEGVMGKGIALQFKRAYPDMFKHYQKLCERNEINVGDLWIYKTPHKWILNFPTKRFWRQPSQLEFIEKGLKKLVDEFSQLKIHSIAFPALGCGNGELDWEIVKPLMERYLCQIPADVFIHPPIKPEEFPEHRNESEIMDWLRSEPAELPFSEVWRDLKSIVSEFDAFETGIRPFYAQIQDDSLAKLLIVTTDDRSYKIEYEDLRDVWSVFRAQGYLRRGMVNSAMEKVLYYIMPVLEKLPYVKKIELSESGNFRTHSVRKRRYTALQYIAPTGNSSQQRLFF